jgi:hypothetical protein
MYCVHCGAERADNASACAQCGKSIPHFAPPEAVPNYLVQSILVTLCCCLPLGVVAVIYSAQVNTKLAAGDVAGARASAARARTWAIVALITGIVSSGAMAALSYFSR